jgi:type II secretory pathway pseudopilin PulG
MRLTRLLNRLREERGYTMIAVVGAMAVVSILVTAALGATNGDLNLVRRDLLDKQAYAAAQAGIADYSYHLNNDNSYWAKCTAVPSPHAVNQVGSTTNRRDVPGTSESSYAIELIPRTGQSACSTSNPVGTMLEQSGAIPGSFRIRSTGYSGNAQVSIVATYKRASLLDYVYFTQLETSDPVTYGNAQTIAGAYIQCTKFIRNGRYSQSIPNSGGQFCDKIVFVDGDEIKGPLHTNDALMICGNGPIFGRGPADVTEVSSPPTGWTGECPGADVPTFRGPFVTAAPVLTPPPTNGKLKTIAGPTYTFTGQTKITLNGGNVTVQVGNGSPTTFPVPASGVIYVANGASCSASYNPFTVTYPTTSGCGNARVTGSGTGAGPYSGQLTIAAENDIIVEGSIQRASGTGGLLGLVANNFVRVKHPVCESNNLSCSSGTVTEQQAKNDCDRDNDGNQAVNGTGSISNLRIDAAILAISHSFIVDHYDCASSLGTLTINGAISQKFRGAVGTTGGTGYLKNYNYDDRLRYQEPPSFLDPVQSAWHIQRETLDFP